MCEGTARRGEEARREGRKATRGRSKAVKVLAGLLSVAEWTVAGRVKRAHGLCCLFFFLVFMER